MTKNPRWRDGGTFPLGVVTTDADALVAELRRREQQLRESQRIAHIGSWEWDLASDRIEWSEELFRIWGLDPGEPFSYAAYVDRLQPDDRERMQKVIAQAIETRSSYVVEHRIVLPEGTERWILGRGTVVCDEQGTAVKVRGTAQDITDRRNAEERALALFREQYERERAEREREELRGRAQELATLAAALERSNRELDAFAYAASHDLRAPLRGIANLAQWIEEDLQDSLSDDTREMLALMRTRMHRMESLIEGILQYSRAGRAHEQPVSVDVCRLVRETIDLLSPESARRRRRGDRHRSEGRGGILGILRHRQRAGDTCRISRAHLGNFPDARSARQGRRDRHWLVPRQETGRGAGRAGWSHIGGRIGRLLLVLVAQDGDLGGVVDEKVLNILLVEDDQVDVMNVRRAFEKNRIVNPLFIAGDGIEALEILRGGLVPAARRIVLLDLNMPRMTGIEFHRLSS